MTIGNDSTEGTRGMKKAKKAKKKIKKCAAHSTKNLQLKIKRKSIQTCIYHMSLNGNYMKAKSHDIDDDKKKQFFLMTKRILNLFHNFPFIFLWISVFVVDASRSMYFRLPDSELCSSYT